MLEVVSEQTQEVDSTQEVQSEGNIEVPVDTNDKESEACLFAELSSHRLSDKGTCIRIL